MPRYPEPPPAGALAARVDPGVKTLDKGALVWRIYERHGRHPMTWNALRHYGPTTSRFDHHDPPPREQRCGILYGATDDVAVYSCFAEFFQKNRTIDRARHAPWLVGFELSRPLRLLDLTGAWPTSAGASQAMNSGRRDRARRWSRRIYEDFPEIEGLYYPSSMNGNAPAVALYERCEDALPSRPLFHRALVDPILDGVVAKASAVFKYPIEPAEIPG